MLTSSRLCPSASPRLRSASARLDSAIDSSAGLSARSSGTRSLKTVCSSIAVLLWSCWMTSPAVKCGAAVWRAVRDARATTNFSPNNVLGRMRACDVGRDLLDLALVDLQRHDRVVAVDVTPLTRADQDAVQLDVRGDHQLVADAVGHQRDLVADCQGSDLL